MQLRDALHRALETLSASQTPSRELASELLLMHVLGCDRAYLYTHPEIQLSETATRRYLELIDERSTGKPTQYITGHQEFWGLDFEVTPDVLIPRPETEHLVEAVLELAGSAGVPFASIRAGSPAVASSLQGASLRIVDVGTGSGCIALALASEFSSAELFAIDLSAAALGVARLNAARLGFADRVKFMEGDLLAPVLGDELAGTFDFVVSNPPYVALDELDSVQREVREFEPRLAWGGIEDSGAIYHRLFSQALEVLRPEGYVVVEIGYTMRDKVLTLLGDGWTDQEVRPDLSGIPRVVVARKRP
ncbi:MAG: peptide chain release factor N(5)-glutamine methyltransferase [Terriglobia bacterium]